MPIIPKLPKGITAVEKPNHPFTFDGPDYLLYGYNGLLAIFEVRKNELKNTSRLFARVTNAIIAYPANTQMLLVVNTAQEIPFKIMHFEGFYFSRSIESKDLRKSHAILKDKKSVMQVKHIKALQHRLFNFQAQVQNDNIDYIKRKKDFQEKILPQSPLRDKAKYFDPLKQKDITVRAQIFEYERHYFGQKKLSNNISDLKDLQPFYEFSIFSEFKVDNGVPYFDNLSRKVLNVDDIPSSRYDPLKPTRVASLFGWHLVNTENFEVMVSRIAKYNR